MKDISIGIYHKDHQYGKRLMEKTCERFIDYVIKVASGEFVNNEKKGYREIAIFKTGVTL